MDRADLERERATWLKYSGSVYAPETITVLPSKDGRENFSDALLRIKHDLVHNFGRGGVLVDLCCGSGAHLLEFAPNFDMVIGLDFSQLFLQYGSESARKDGVSNASFMNCTARALPLRSMSVDFLYSFASLYHVAGVSTVIEEVGRVLRPGGRCIFELGNYWSLNTIVCKAHPELAYPFHVPVSQMLKAVRDAGLSVLVHRAFQMLPMWSDRPRWLRFVHAEFAKRTMTRSLRGKMVDEWICNIPGMKRLAFRHILVCERPDLSSESAGA